MENEASSEIGIPTTTPTSSYIPQVNYSKVLLLFLFVCFDYLLLYLLFPLLTLAMM